VLGDVLIGIGSIMTGLGTVATAIQAGRGRSIVSEVATTADATHAVASSTLAQVSTMNGKSIAQLADEAEGYRIRAEISPADQTASEKHYVEALRQADKLTSQEEHKA
jgi:hypothetical protein